MKLMLFRAMKGKKTRRWVDLVDKIFWNYNHSYHSTKSMKPADVKKGGEIEELVWRRQYEEPVGPRPDGPFKFEVGDLVRLSHVAHAFTREFDEKYTRELFHISSRKRRGPLNVYTVRDLNKEEIEGTFYQAELQAVTVDLSGEFDMEKVLRTRKVKGKKEYLVRWANYPPSFDSWVSEEDLA